MMHDHGKSDRPIVPAKAPNEAEPGEAKEVLEGRGLAKGNAPERNVSRTQSRIGMSSALERIRWEASGGRNERRYHSYTLMRLALLPEARAGCGSSASPDPCGGSPARAIPTATPSATDQAQRMIAHRQSGQAQEHHPLCPLSNFQQSAC